MASESLCVRCRIGVSLMSFHPTMAKLDQHQSSLTTTWSTKGSLSWYQFCSTMSLPEPWDDHNSNTLADKKRGDMANTEHLSFLSPWLITLYNNKTFKRLNLNWGCDYDTINQTLEESCYTMCFKHWSTSLKVGLKYNRDTGYWIHKKGPGCWRLLCVSMWYVAL